MARRKHKRTHHRRHRVSGTKSTVMNTAALVGGAAIGAFANQMIAKFTATSTSTAVKLVAPIGTIALGAFLVPKFIKSEMGKNLGYGIAAAGGLFTLNATVLKIPGLAGVGTGPVFRDTRKIQQTVGAPGFVDNAVNGVMDPAIIGTVWMD